MFVIVIITIIIITIIVIIIITAVELRTWKGSHGPLRHLGTCAEPRGRVADSPEGGTYRALGNAQSPC